MNDASLTPLAATTCPSAQPHRARRFATRTLALVSLASLFSQPATAQSILGSTEAFGVMAGSTVTINGIATINGNLGAANIAGAGSYTLTGATVIPITTQNQADFTKAFNGLAAMTPTVNLTGKTLGTTAGATVLAPGIYNFNTIAELAGTLTLDAQFQSNAVWVFQIDSTFTTAAGSQVIFTHLADNSVATSGLFWQVGTTTTLGANTHLEGNILGGTTFDLGSGATLDHGRLLTGSGTITLAGNVVDFIGAGSGYSGGLAFDQGGTVISAVPEPSTYALVAGATMFAAVLVRRRTRRGAPPA